MSVLSPASKPAAPTPLGDTVTAALIIIIPLALALICFAARLHIIELSHTVRAELLFALLLALMASGMPISIPTRYRRSSNGRAGSSISAFRSART